MSVDGGSTAALPAPATAGWWTGAREALLLPLVALGFLAAGAAALVVAPAWADRVWMAGLVLAGARPV